MNKLSQVKDLQLSVKMTKGDLESLSKMTNLEDLTINRLDMDDPLRECTKLTNLRSLRLSSELSLSDGLKHLSTLPTLKQLDLNTPDAKDVLNKLANLKQLEKLKLKGSDLSDKELTVLPELKLPKLKELRFDDLPRHLKGKPIERLKKSLPDVDIHFDVHKMEFGMYG